MTIHQLKLMHENASYPFADGGRVRYGRLIGWGQDDRGFGAVVVSPFGEKTFWVLDERTMRIHNQGRPPRQRQKPVQTLTLIPHLGVWRGR